MHKIYLFLLLTLLPSILVAQERSLIILERSENVTVDTKTNISYVRKPTFKHDNATLTCDSAVFYKARNFFEAFQNVHINQGDTVNIYSDFLNYDGNTKLAHLTSNVRMLTPTSTLTTSVLDYNTGTKIGQYYDGGKIINADATITSKRGWYFTNSRDAFFRYDVLVKTPQTTITSDTLRYNTASNWTYFYGPTNIKGKDDNLYTENGAYNTKSENAYFGKKNLYTNASRSLKGDSLYYYGKTGYGKAVKNIVYIDTTDKMLLRGQLGEYYKLDEKIVVTRNAYVGMDSKDSVTINNKKVADTLWLGADTLEAQKVLQQTLTLIIKPTVIKDSDLGAAEKKAQEEKDQEKAAAKKAAAEEAKKTPAVSASATVNQPKKLTKKEQREANKKAKENPPAIIDSTAIKKQLMLRDSTTKDSLLKLTTKKIALRDSIPANTKAVSKKITDKAKAIANAKIVLPKNIKTDSTKAFNPADTVRARVIKAYHNVRVFKSNMQAKADSLFYTSADSTLRWYKDPILWAEGSQQTGDTIHVFFKDKKVNSFQVLQNGFIVNVETDSTKFNQVKGKKITGFFSGGDLKNMFVDGNAESIYYTKKDNGEYDNMNQSVSSRIKFIFDKKELTDISMYKEVEGKANPIDKLPKESLLTGFIWKPELRPTSKADIIKGRPVVKSAAKKSTPIIKGKVPAKKTSVKLNTPLIKDAKSLQDSIRAILPVVKPMLDSLKKQIDTTAVKTLIKQNF